MVATFRAKFDEGGHDDIKGEDDDIEESTEPSMLDDAEEFIDCEEELSSVRSIESVASRILYSLWLVNSIY